MNFCKDCKFIALSTDHDPLEKQYEYARCNRDSRVIVDPVSGLEKQTGGTLYCDVNRVVGACGPEAKFFERKEK